MSTPELELTENETPSPVIPWEDFRRWFSGEWEQGQHVMMVGTTGSGKTTVAKQFLKLREHVVVFGVKSRDDTLDELIRKGYWRTGSWQGDVSDHIVLWPEVKGARHAIKQREIFEDAMDAIYRSGGWCLYLDEVSYLADTLSMNTQLKFMLNQGRSCGISIVAATQRPAWIPVAFYDQSTHLFLWKDNDHKNIKRMSELAGPASRVVFSEIGSLERREVLYLNKDTGYRCRTKVVI